jgi:hypothetical protein
MTDETFNVVQFFSNGMYEYVRRNVSDMESVTAFKHYTTSVAAKTGIVTRVIITDGGDNTNLAWEFGKGFTYDGVWYAESPHSSLHPHIPRQANDD